MKPKRKITQLYAALMLIIVSCTFTSTYLNREEDKRKAEQVTNRLFDYIQKNEYDKSFQLFSNTFWTVTSKDKLREILTVTQKKLGRLDSTRLGECQTRRITGTSPSGEYLLVYKNHYHNYEATETIRLVLEEKEKIRIIAYNINSEGFFK
jgi:hypothetical protein